MVCIFQGRRVGMASNEFQAEEMRFLKIPDDGFFRGGGKYTINKIHTIV